MLVQLEVSFKCLFIYKSLKLFQKFAIFKTININVHVFITNINAKIFIQCILNLSTFNFSKVECAYCRVTSFMGITSYGVFKGEEKKALFQQHRSCELNDPVFESFMGEIDSEEWLTFIDLMLNSEERLLVNYDVINLCDFAGLTLTCHGEKLIGFYLGNEEFFRFIIYLRLPGNLDFQLVLSDEDIELDEADYDYADRFVGYLNQQWMHSSKAFPNALDDTDNNFNFLMVRKFGGINCILGIELRYPQPTFDPNDPDALMRDTISNLYKTNFLWPDNSRIADVCRYLLLFENS